MGIYPKPFYLLKEDYRLKNHDLSACRRMDSCGLELVPLGLSYWGYIGIMEKKMDTTIMRLYGV